MKIALLLMPLLLAACGGGGGTPPGPNPNPNPNPGQCANTITQNITIATTWRNTPSACDYLIVGPGDNGRGYISVTNGMLTIEPGTVIRFAQDAGLDFRNGGGLQAVGTPQARIRFEGASPVRGFGLGVFFAPQSLLSRLEHTDLAYLGKRDTGVWKFHNAAVSGLQNEGLIIKNTTISGSVYYGLEMDNLIIREFANNTFKGNTRNGVLTSAAQLPKLDAASDYAGQGDPNGEPYVLVDGVSNDERATQDATWKKLNAPYYVENAVYIESADITIEPGVKFVFGQGAGLNIQDNGSLKAIGTASEPIVFTGREAQKGYWGSLVFFQTKSPNNRFEHVEVRYGGGGGSIYPNSIDLPYQSRLEMSNTTVADSANWGVCVGLESELVQGLGNQFSGNQAGNVGTEADGCD